MQRNTNLREILFPVELRDTYYEFARRAKAADSADVQSTTGRAVNYKAVVNAETGELLCIVNRNYRLVTNEEALALGKQCFIALFNSPIAEMKIFNIFAPASKSFCHVDLIHEKYTLNIWRTEVWIPYIRITNSYNRSRALRLCLGFCRQLCTNGLVFERETITYTFYHTKREIARKVRLEVDSEKLRRVERTFVGYMNKLNEYPVPTRFVLPAVCKALDIRFDLQSEDQKKRQREEMRLERFKAGVRLRTERYYGELGENAYALLNVVSDIASSPFFVNAPSAMVDTFQKRAGNWIESFTEEIRSKDFDFEKYLDDYSYLLN